MTADNGKALFCTLPTPREQISLSKECSLVVPDLSQAVTSFMWKSLEDIQLFLYNMQNGCIAEVYNVVLGPLSIFSGSKIIIFLKKKKNQH